MQYVISINGVNTRKHIIIISSYSLREEYSAKLYGSLDLKTKTKTKRIDKTKMHF